MKLKKEDLLRIIQEQHAEIDELASRAKHGYETKGRSEQDIIKEPNGNVIGFKMLDYTNDPIEGEKIPIVMVCGGVDAVQRILDDNPELIKEIEQEFPNHPVMWSAHKKDINTYCIPPRSAKHQLNPLPGREGEVQPRVANTAKPIQKPREISTKIEREFNKVVNEEVGNRNPEATARLQECSIPPILGNDIKHINRNNLFSNQKVNYKTHNIDIYEDVEDFIDKAQTRALGGQAAATMNRSLRYRYNEKYSKWGDKRSVNIDTYGRKQEYKGKTAVYNVDYLDFSNSRSDASVLSELTIEGNMSADQTAFTWKVTFDIKFGDALAEGIRGYYSDLKPSRTITGTTTVEVDPNEQFGESYTIMDSRSIYEGLRQVLYDLREQFFNELNPVEALTLPELNQERISTGSKMQDAMNESMVDRIMDKIMKRK